MATDYDAPRKTEEDLSEDSIEALKARRTEKPSAVVDEDESDLAEGYELPGADLSGEELLVRVLPGGGPGPPEAVLRCQRRSRGFCARCRVIFA